MAIRRTVARWILEQKVGNSRGSRLMFLNARNLDNHSLHAGRLGRFGRRVPCNDREGCIPDEGSGSPWCFCVFAAAGCHKSVARPYDRLTLRTVRELKRPEVLTKRGTACAPLTSRGNSADGGEPFTRKRSCSRRFSRLWSLWFLSPDSVGWLAGLACSTPNAYVPSPHLSSPLLYRRLCLSACSASRQANSRMSATL